MKTKLLIDQSRLLGFKVLGVKVTEDSKGENSSVGANIGKSVVGAKIGKLGKVPIIVGAKIGKIGKVGKVPSW